METPFRDAVQVAGPSPGVAHQMELPACKVTIPTSVVVYVAPLAKFTKAIAQWQMYLQGERFMQEILESILALEENADKELKRLEHMYEIERAKLKAPEVTKPFMQHLSKELKSICKDTADHGLQQLANDVDSLQKQAATDQVDVAAVVEAEEDVSTAAFTKKILAMLKGKTVEQFAEEVIAFRTVRDALGARFTFQP